MTDITKCISEGCHKRLECLRYTAPPTPRQSYSNFEALDETDDHGVCLYHIENGMRWHRQHRIIRQLGRWNIVSGRHKAQGFDSLQLACDYIDEMIWSRE